MQEVHQVTLLGQWSNTCLTSQSPLHHQGVPQKDILHGQVTRPSTTIVVIIVDHAYDLKGISDWIINNPISIPDLFQGWIQFSPIPILAIVAVLVRNGNITTTNGC
jgi:hypothetical protein